MNSYLRSGRRFSDLRRFGLNYPYYWQNTAVGTINSSSLSSGKQWANVSIRCFSKFISKSARKRLPLTAKRAKKGYVKGKGSTTEGRHKGGRYIMDPKKMLKLIIPDLTNFNLKPYIAASVSKLPPENRRKAP